MTHDPAEVLKDGFDAGMFFCMNEEENNTLNLFRKLFLKNPLDLVAQGEGLLLQDRFFEARASFEKALELLGEGSDAEELVSNCIFHIKAANLGLSRKNIGEAARMIERGEPDKAKEHLEVAERLTDDLEARYEMAGLLEKIDELAFRKQAQFSPKPFSGCGSCVETVEGNDGDPSALRPVTELSDPDFFVLLTSQLPDDIAARYNSLGEKFAQACTVAWKDDHLAALTLLDEWHDGENNDIYFYEKGMALYRSGNLNDAVNCLSIAAAADGRNPLPRFALAQLMIELEKYDEAGLILDSMISGGLLAEQAIMLRADLCCSVGDIEGGLNRYFSLLQTSFARQAAEMACRILTECGRESEASAISKRYLKGCSG